MATLILFIRMAILAAPAPAHVAPHGATYLDLSGPSEPESEFPTIASKGRL